MTNEQIIISEIVELCFSLDMKAVAIYTKFADKSADPGLAEDWRAIAEEEREHVSFWEKARAFCANEYFAITIENPQEIKENLTKINRTLLTMITTFKNYDDPVEEVMLSYILEAYLLDASFMSIFHMFRFVDEEIEEDYEQHIAKFIDLMKRFHAGTIPLQVEIMGETLQNLYRLNKKLSVDSMTDSLTGLLNRRGFFNTVKPYLGYAARNDLNVGIIMTDLDDFKQVNEVHGHPVGDKALKSAAFMLESCLRKSDIAGRYGGEEFIIFADAGTSDSLQCLCERIREKIERNSELLAGVPFTISLGVAVGKISQFEEQSLSELINLADHNLHEAKISGKNRWVS